MARTPCCAAPAGASSFALCTEHLYAALCKSVATLTLVHLCLCCQTAEEDLNLDSEPTIEDTVEEVIIHVLLEPGSSGRKLGWKEDRKLEMNSLRAAL